MKIALILAPTFPRDYPLIGLACLSAVLRQAGHETKIFDFASSLDFPHSGGESRWNEPSFVQEYDKDNPEFFGHMCAQLSAYAPDIAAFSVWQCNAPASRLLCSMLKKRLPGVFCVFGGPEPGFRPETFFAPDSSVDFVVRGEGENAVLELAARLSHGKLDFPPPPGVMFKSGGRVVDGGAARQIENLDSLPFPDFEGFPLHRFASKLLPVSFNRGCPHRCAFCNTAASWRGCRHRAPEKVYEELLQDNRRYGAENFFFCCPAVNAGSARLSRLCGLLLDGHKQFTWNSSAFFSDALTSELIAKMGRCGARLLDFGLESGSPRVLRSMGKPFSPETAARNIRDCHAAGIAVFLNIVIGFPGEQPEDLELTKKFLLENRQYIARIGPPSECVAARGSLLAEQPQRYGLDPVPHKELSCWESADGSSTHAKRRQTLVEFTAWARAKQLPLA
ncbi:MAG TPA: radical SAM protein [Elusimicrobiales bacterium]|nr:radical SAM protein [Elusimicrobiales bacterium]